ncbi:MAG TPA: hypothetical protein VL119_03455, partial [Acidimicrobiia bacterium]|nr:hypothetical protein [Acidimicrobiia bacterium]
MGESLPAYLSLRSTEPLHDLSIHVSGDGGGANLGTAHVPQTVGSSPSWATLDLDVNNPGTGTFDARITAHDAANRSVTASESFSYATAARTVTLSTSGLADAELQALSLRRESMSTSAYARAASVLTTGKAQQAAAVEHAITDASPVDMTTVTGQIRYTDVNGQTHPAREIDVDILDDTGVAGGARAGCATTDANGDFSATVATARTDGTPRKLYLRAWAQSVLPAVVPNNPCAWRTQNGGTGTGFVVVDPATNQNQSVTSSTVVNATTGSVTMPTLVIGASNAASTSFDVADAMVTGDDYLNKYRGNPYGFLAVDYPWTKLDSDGDPQMYFNAPTTIVVPAGEQFNWDSMLHEFGHYVGFNLNIDTSGGGAHGFSQNDASVCQQSKGPCNPLGKKAGLAQAWSEGFATFFSLMAQNVMNVAALNIPDAGDASYDDHQVHLDDIQMGVDNASLDGQLPAKGEDDELSVVRALWHIYTDSSLGLSDAGILNGLHTAGASTLSAAVPALLDAAGATPFDASKPLDSQAEKKTDTVACVLTGQAVSPEITDPPSVSTAGSAYPPTISWNPNGAGPLNPLEQFQVQFWSADWTQLLFTSPPTTDNFYAPAPAQWHSLLSITENGNPISAYHVAVVGTSTDPPSTGPYRSCAITLNAPETPAELKGPGPSGGDLTGQSVGISRDGSDAIVGSPGTCDGYGATDACDLSSIGFWSYDATTAAWKQLASFDQEQLGITGCGPGDCSEAVSVGTSVAMSGDGLTAAATVAIDPTYTPGDSDGPWSIAVVTFAKENGTWVLTGEPGPNGEDGVIDNGIDQSTLSLVYHVPLESVALDNTGDELLVGDPYHTNDLNLLSTAENPKNSQGIVDVFSSAGHGDPSGFRSTSTIADPTVDPFLSDEASCTNPDADCTNWDEHFALPIAVSGDGKTVAISDTAEYYTRAASYNIFETVDVFHGTGTGAARSWGMPTALNGSDVNTVYSVPLGGGFECNGVPCTGPDDFGAALTNSDTPPGSGIAISDDGST